MGQSRIQQRRPDLLARMPLIAYQDSMRRWDALPVFEAGGLRTIEAADSRVVGIPKHGAGHHLLGTVSSWEEAAVVATILRLFNPN